jgi:heme/copper-type cytochrome/quinol oxidase subunit 2
MIPIRWIMRCLLLPAYLILILIAIAFAIAIVNGNDNGTSATTRKWRYTAKIKVVGIVAWIIMPALMRIITLGAPTIMTTTMITPPLIS